MVAKPIVIDFDAKVLKLFNDIQKLNKYSHTRVQVSRFARTANSQSWLILLETPENVVNLMEELIEKDPYMHVLNSGVTKGNYDWSADVYNRDHCWVKYIISASKP